VGVAVISMVTAAVAIIAMANCRTLTSGRGRKRRRGRGSQCGSTMAVGNPLPYFPSATGNGNGENVQHNGVKLPKCSRISGADGVFTGRQTFSPLTT